MRRSLPYILLFALLTFPMQLLCIPKEVNVLMDSAKSAYDREAYQKALTLYQKVAKDYRAPSLYHNLGNAALKAEKLGKAVLYYQKGQKLAPWDPDIQHNLSIAQSRTRDEFQNDPSQTLWGAFKDFLVVAPIGGWWGWSLTFSFLTFASFLLIALGPEKVRSLALGSAILGLFLTLLFYGGYKGKERILGSKDRAVIQAPSVQVRSAPKTSSSTAFVLHEGTTVDVREDQEEWTEIRTPDEQIGWIRTKDLTRF